MGKHIADDIVVDAGLWSRCIRVLAKVKEAYTTPATWHRGDDQQKTLPAQWKIIGSKWRYLPSLFPYLGPPTHSLYRIFWPLATVMVMCVAIKYANGKVAWSLDQYNNYAYFFRLSSFLLSLLLGARLNRAYDRWWLTRCSFGGIGGGVVNVVRQIATYSNDPILLRQYQKWGMCMVYGIVQLINDTPHLTDPRVKQLLEPDELALYESTTKPSKLCGTMLSALTSAAGFAMEREVYINQALGAIAANISTVARIKLQAMPQGMTIFCTGYAYIWLLLLPFGIFPEANWSALLPVFVMATMMLALEDLAIQMEDPFKFFAYEAMVATTAKDMPRTVREVKDCQSMITNKYMSQMNGGMSEHALPPWPILPKRPQKR